MTYFACGFPVESRASQNPLINGGLFIKY